MADDRTGDSDPFGAPPPAQAPPPPPAAAPPPPPPGAPPPAAMGGSPGGNGPGRPGRTGLLVAGVVAVLALIGGGVFVLTSGGDDDDDADEVVATTTEAEPDDTDADEPEDTASVDTASDGPLDTAPDQPAGLPAPEPAGTEPSAPDSSEPDEPGPGGSSTNVPEPTIEAEGLGDDYVLDLYARPCYEGALILCDHLALEAPTGSVYEEFARTCAGRIPLEADTFCHPLGGLDAPSESVWSLDVTVSYTVLEAAARCWVGVMSECDVLDEMTDDATFLQFGDKCGGRRPASADPCVDAYPQWLALHDLAHDTSGQRDATVEPPTDDGSTPRLAALADACYEGALIACDELYAFTAEHPVYEAYAQVCAGRWPPGTDQFCSQTVDFPPPNEQPWDLPSGAVGAAPFLQDLALRCWAGVMEACDALYGAADAHPTYQEYADTCAYRQETGTQRYCTDAFPAWSEHYSTTL